MSNYKKKISNGVKFINKLIYKSRVNLDIDNKASETLKPKLKEYNESRDYGYQNMFCFAPNTSLYFSINGDILVCCKNTDSKLGNIANTKVLDAWNSKVRMDLIKNIANYKLHSGCDFCERMIEAKNYNAVHARIYDRPFNKTQNYPIDITLEISNTCNLECVMCIGDYSSSIRKNREYLTAKKDVYPDDFFEQLKPFLKQLKTIRLQGGEPFLIEDYYKIIEYLNKNNQHCKIYIQSNGTIFNNRVKTLFSSSKNIFLSISIDGFTQDSYEKIRVNAKFKIVIRNIKLFGDVTKRNKSQLNINFCLMKDNWQDIPLLFDFCNTNQYTMSIIPVEYPTYLSLNTLETKILIQILAFLSSKRLEPYVSSSGNELEMLKDYVGSCVVNSEKRMAELNKLLSFSTEELIDNLISYLTQKLDAEFALDFYNTIKIGLKNKSIAQQKYLYSITILNNRILESFVEVSSKPNREIKNKLLEYFNYEKEKYK